MKKLTILLLAIGVLPVMLAGCNTTALSTDYVQGARYNGPGTFEQFSKVRSQCIRRINAKKSDENKGGLINCSAFVQCLAAKGYHLDPNGKFDPAHEGIGIDCNFK